MEGDVIREAGHRELGRCCAANFEDGVRGHEPRKAGTLQKLEKARK